MEFRFPNTYLDLYFKKIATLDIRANPSDYNKKIPRVGEYSGRIYEKDIFKSIQIFCNDRNLDFPSYLGSLDWGNNNSSYRRIFSKKNGKGVSLEHMDVLSMYLTKNLDTSFLVHFNINTTSELIPYIHPEKLDAFRKEENLLNLYRNKDLNKFPFELKEKIKSIKIDHIKESVLELELEKELDEKKVGLWKKIQQENKKTITEVLKKIPDNQLLRLFALLLLYILLMIYGILAFIAFIFKEISFLLTNLIETKKKIIVIILKKNAKHFLLFGFLLGGGIYFSNTDSNRITEFIDFKADSEKSLIGGEIKIKVCPLLDESRNIIIGKTSEYTNVKIMKTSHNMIDIFFPPASIRLNKWINEKSEVFFYKKESGQEIPNEFKTFLKPFELFFSPYKSSKEIAKGNIFLYDSVGVILSKSILVNGSEVVTQYEGSYLVSIPDSLNGGFSEEKFENKVMRINPKGINICSGEYIMLIALNFDFNTQKILFPVPINID